MGLRESYLRLKARIVNSLSTKGIYASTDEGLTTLINKVDDVTVNTESLECRIIWNDSNDNSRPQSVQVYVFNNHGIVIKQATLNTANNWFYLFEDVPLRAYVLCETPIGYNKAITGSAASGYIITMNKKLGSLIITSSFEIDEPESQEEEEEGQLFDIPVVMIWNDNDNSDLNRPNNATIHLYSGGDEIDSAILSTANNWQYTFTDLLRYSHGVEVRYTISVDPIIQYTTSVNGYTIKNTYSPDLTQATVRKVWDDDNDSASLRPSSIMMTLSDGKRVVLTEANGWTATISGLPTTVNHETVTYTWTEQSIVGYTLQSQTTAGTVTTFTNTVSTRPDSPTPGKPPKTPGGDFYDFEDYEDPL